MVRPPKIGAKTGHFLLIKFTMNSDTSHRDQCNGSTGKGTFAHMGKRVIKKAIAITCSMT